jgi:hypothetical protein
MYKTSAGIEYDAFQAVDLVIPGISGGQTATQFFFPDLPYLRPQSADIVAIETYTINSLTNGTVTNTPLASIAISKTAGLTLYGGIKNPENGEQIKQGNQIIQALPILRLNNLQNGSTDPFTGNIFKLNQMQVDWTKCFVQLSAAPGNTSNICFSFGIYFNFAKQFN